MKNISMQLFYFVPGPVVHDENLKDISYLWQLSQACLAGKIIRQSILVEDILSYISVQLFLIWTSGRSQMLSLNLCLRYPK